MLILRYEFLDSLYARARHGVQPCIGEGHSPVRFIMVGVKLDVFTTT